jgi:hypothetical protein
MKTFFVSNLVVLQIALQHAAVPFLTAPFTSHPAATTVNNIIPAKLLDTRGHYSHNRVELDWTVQDNGTSDSFEVQKSVDGHRYSPAALVWSTEEKNTEHYIYRDHAPRTRMIYRVKLINKDRTIEYSEAIIISPNS